MLKSLLLKGKLSKIDIFKTIRFLNLVGWPAAKSMEGENLTHQ